MRYYCLLTESNIGIHTKTKNGGRVPFEVICGTFFPIVEKINGRFVLTSPNNKIVEEAVSKYNLLAGSFDVYFLVGFDLDATGECMSTAVRNELIKYGMEPSRIIRMPLTEAGYCLIKEFTEPQKYLEFLHLQKEFLKFQKKLGVTKPLGIKKAMAIEMLHTFKGKKTALNTNISDASQTSTATVVTQFILDGAIL